jgi:hypothetical protein
LFVSVGPLGASANLLINGGFDNPALPVSFPTAMSLDTISVAAVPEPSTWAMMIGFMTIAGKRCARSLIDPNCRSRDRLRAVFV